MSSLTSRIVADSGQVDCLVIGSAPRGSEILRDRRVCEAATIHMSCYGTPAPSQRSANVALARDPTRCQAAVEPSPQLRNNGIMRRAGTATAYLLRGSVTAVAAAGAVLAVVASVLLCLVLVGVALLPEVARGVGSLAAAEQLRSGRLLGSTVPQRYAKLSGSSLTQLRTLLRNPTTWRDLLWLVIHATGGLLLGMLWLVLCLCLLAAPFVMAVWWTQPTDTPVTFFVAIDSWQRALTVPPLIAAGSLALLVGAGPVVATAQAKLYRSLLAPSTRDRLAARVEQLSVTRAAALDAHAAELRRIERDLHDGMQARLVNVAIQLGVAQRQRERDPDSADQLIERAHAGVQGTLAALRDVVRTIYPPILADRGLTEAVRTLAAECPVPVRISIGTLTRPPAAVESAAYFLVAEALTNIVKHSDATEATLTLDQRGDWIMVEVTDNGRGGADPRGGTGLTGMAHRAAALDGRVTLDSPPGGPTTLHVGLPCVS
jgi:signal transduction histidine kinase